MNYLKPILALTLALGSTLAHASVLGTPDQDPVIKDLRARFEKGTAPTQEELVGKIYHCKYRDSYRDSFKMEDIGNHSFSAFDGYIILSAKMSKLDGQTFVNNSREWIATLTTLAGNIGFEAYRKDSKGYLIGEWGHTNTNSRAELTPLSAAPSGARVVQYGICIPKK
jgi:hypothetical protein